MAYTRKLRSGLVRTGVGVLVGAGVLAFAGPSSLEAQEPAAAGVVVDSVLVRGQVTLEESAILGTIAIPTGVPITFRELQEAQKRLWATGRFSDVTVTARGGVTDDDPVILIFEVAERPVVRRVTVEGLTRISERQVRDTVGLRAGDPYHPQRVAQARRFIQDELAKQGVPFARIEEHLIPVPGAQNEVELRLEVEEGHRVTVAQVVVHGNEAFRDSELAKVLATRPEGFWWWRTGEFRQDDLNEDLRERLPEFYASNGFLDFEVLGDTLIIDPTTGKARLELQVEEGPQYRVAEFRIEGNRRFPTEDLERYYRLEEGGLLRSLGIGRARQPGPPVFDQTAFEDATRQVEERYLNEGYLYIQVRPALERRPPAEAGAPHTVAVRWEVEEGQPAYIRRIHIRGNDFTHDRIIRDQIMVIPGDVYSQDRLLRSYQSISGLGFFETPLPFPDVEPDPQTGDVDITFEVQERQTGSINFGTAMGGMTGVAGFIGYEQPNLFGQGKSGNLRWDFGRYQNNFQVQYSDPSLRQSRVSGQISLFDSRDRFFTFATGERRMRGIQTQFGVPVPGSVRTRLFVGYGLSRTRFRLREGVDDTSLFGRPPGTQSQLSTGIARRTLDHPLFPTVGSSLRWTTAFTGGVLGGDASFIKHTAEAEWWVPIGQVGGTDPGSRPVRFALGLRARGGAITGDADRFPFDRFWLGGVQFGEALRGYDETTITPGGYFPRRSQQINEAARLGDAFMVIGAEYAIRLMDNVSVSTFYEAGNLWRSPQEFDPTRLLRGAGIGLKLVTPFGPIGLDYAYGFDKDNPGWQLHFNMGGMGGPF
jgi:outer membrane protein insertion porin family